MKKSLLFLYTDFISYNCFENFSILTIKWFSMTNSISWKNLFFCTVRNLCPIFSHNSWRKNIHSFRFDKQNTKINFYRFSISIFSYCSACFFFLHGVQGLGLGRVEQGAQDTWAVCPRALGRVSPQMQNMRSLITIMAEINRKPTRCIILEIPDKVSLSTSTNSNAFIMLSC